MHKKFIKRGEKQFGPYYYANFRDKNGKVQSFYLGQDEQEALRKEEELKSRLYRTDSPSKLTYSMKVGIVLMIVILAIAAVSFSYTGHIVGFFTQAGSPENMRTYTDARQLYADESIAYDWDLPEHPSGSSLRAVMLSGRLETLAPDASLKVYLEHMGERVLILEGSSILGQWTGQADSMTSDEAQTTEEAGNETGIDAQPLNDTFQEAENVTEPQAPPEEPFEPFTTYFEAACADTCILPEGFESDSYRLVIEIEGGELHIANITYSLEGAATQEGPEEANVTEEEFDVMADVRDASGNMVAADIEFMEGGSLKYQRSLRPAPAGPARGAPAAPPQPIKVKKGKYDVVVRPQGHPVKEIIMKGVDISSDTGNLIDIDDTPEFGDYVEVYAIDPSMTEFEEGEVTATAKGTSLYKCKDWDFQAQACYGSWAKIMDLVPGQEYTFTLTPEDPAFAEAGPYSILECTEGGTSGACNLAYLQADDTSYEQFRVDKNGINRLNTSHNMTIPAKAIILNATACILAYRDSILGDDAGDSCAIYAGENATGTPTYTTAVAPSQSACLNWSTTTGSPNLVCGEVTSWINSKPDPRLSAQKMIVSFVGLEQADNNVDLWIDWIYTNITYDLDTIPPQWSGLSQNSSTVAQAGSVKLSAYWTDNYNLSYALLETNETGAWQNKTAYGSPLALSGNATWSNFTWQNASVPTGTYVGWRIWANDTSDNWNSTDTMSFYVMQLADTYAPNITFVSQSPPDIDTLNILGQGANITYNITDATGVNDSTVMLYHKTNTTTSNVFYYVNGTPVSGYQTALNRTNTSVTWKFSLSDSEVYPATYNIDEWYMEHTPHSTYDLGSSNSYMKIRLFNVSGSKQYSIFEVMAANQTASSGILNIYYCNSSYASGKPSSSPFCTNFYNLPATALYSHWHSAYSGHYAIPFAINLTTGKVGGVYVTNTSYFLLRGVGWSVYYISNVTRPDTIQTTANSGNSWSNFAGTADAHLHQYDGTDTFWYYLCANDTLGNGNCSAARYDLIGMGNLPPTAPNVYSPAEAHYRGNTSINYTSSLSPNGYPIAKYNISLLYANWTFLQTIAGNNYPKLGYTWNTSTVADRQYVVRVEACDNMSLCSYGYSENFTIDNTAPAVSFVPPTEPDSSAIGRNYAQANVTAIDTNPANITVYLYNSTGQASSISGNGSQLLANFTGLQDGNYTFSASASDVAGNINWSGQNITFAVDTQAPKWSGLQKNETNVYWNSSVRFNASWTDDRALAGYIFSTNQSGGWAGSPYTQFSGTSNTSENTSAITAAAGTLVGWYFWANDTAGNSNQTDTQTFTVQARPTSLAFSVNQTVYQQGRSPGHGYDVYIPFQVRYADTMTGAPVSGAACYVTNNETGDNVTLAYNGATGNYTGQVTDYMMYSTVGFSAECSKANYAAASNTTSANVWFYAYLWEWSNTSYGAGSNYTTHWLRRENTTGSVYTLTKQMAAAAGSTLVEEFLVCASGTNCSFLKDFSMIGAYKLRLNVSINDTACEPELCFAIRNFYLDELHRDCSAAQAIPANTPTVIEVNMTPMHDHTINQKDYIGIQLRLNCSSGADEEVKVYYNYSGQPASMEVPHNQPHTIISYFVAYKQLEQGYIIGPNGSTNASGKMWITFYNSDSAPRYMQYWYIPPILAEYPNSIMPNTVYIYNSTGQLWASDNASAGAPYTANLHPDNMVDWLIEAVPAYTAINQTAFASIMDGTRDTENLLVNTSNEKEWSISVWTIGGTQMVTQNVTVWTNYSAYGVPDDFGFQVNLTNSSGTYDITGQIGVYAGNKTLYMPAVDVGAISFLVSAKDGTPPSISFVPPTPENGTSRSLNWTVINASISDNTEADSCLLEWNGTNETMAKVGSGAGIICWLNKTGLAEGHYTFRVWANDTAGNMNASEAREVTIDTTLPVITVLGCDPYMSPVNGAVTCNATITSINGISYVSANVTLPNGTVMVQPAGNVSSNYYFTFTFTQSEGRHNVTWHANNTVGSDATAGDHFLVIIPPAVEINWPLGGASDENGTVIISANVTDQDGVDTVTAQVTLPDSSVESITLGYGQQGDGFGSDTMNASWFKEETIGPGQACVADIDTTVPGKAFTSISGDGTPETDTLCTIMSENRVDGDFDINVSFDILGAGPAADTALNFELTEDKTTNSPRLLFMALANFSGSGQRYEIFADDGSFSGYILLRPTSDTSGKMRIRRAGDNFTFYTWNSTSSSWTEEGVSRNEFNFSRALHISLESESAYPAWGSLNASWDNFSVWSNNFTFAAFGSTAANGTYNVTIIANDTNGWVNGTEKTDFTVQFFNDPPSAPWVLAPHNGQMVGGLFNVTWSQVFDDESDSLQFNISLLNPDQGFNSTVVSNYGESSVKMYEWNTTAYQDGPYSIRVTVFENETAEGNNNSDLLEGNFTIDNTPPDVQFVAPTEASGSLLAARNYIMVNVTASGVNLWNITVYLYNSTSLVNSTATASLTNFANFTGLPDGLYHFNATATDAARNMNYTETRNVTIDITKPMVTLNYPPAGHNSSIGTIDFNWTAADGVDNNLTCNLTIDSIVNASSIDSISGTPTNYTVSGLSYGAHYWNVTCWDDANNTNTSETRNVNIQDTVNPVSLPLSPPDYALDVDRNITFICNATDDLGLQRIELYLSGQLNQSHNVSGASNQTTFYLTGLQDGNYVWKCRAYDMFDNFDEIERALEVNATKAPVCNSSYFSGSTTDWNSSEDIQSVCSGEAILDSPSTDMIQWWGCVDAESADFDSAVHMGYNNVTVVAEALDATFNSSATITMRNLPWDATPLVYMDGALCPQSVCGNASYNASAGTAVFNVTHFTSYTTQGNANLAIWDETDAGMPYGGQDRYPNETVLFFANYTKKNDGSPIAGAVCYINFTGSSGLMSYNGTDEYYGYNRSFPTNGTFQWNVTCSAAGSQTLAASDTVYINQTIDSAPPHYTNDQDNSSGSVIAGEAVLATAYWHDLTALDTAIFRTNRTGSWVNTSYCSLSGTADYCNATIDTTGDAGKTVCWNQYANDTLGNLNTSMPYRCFTVVASNTAPNTTTPVIYPASAYTTDALYCSAALTDSEQASLTAYWTWYNGSSAYLGGSAQASNATGTNITVLMPGNTTKGDTWTCQAIPSDGIANGTALNSTGRLILNAPPSITNVNVTPDTAYTANDLTCAVSGWSDADSDSQQYYYSWYNGTALMFTYLSGSASSALGNGNTTEGDIWNCTVTPHDGEANGTALSDSVTILAAGADSTPPSMTSHSIDPYDPTVGYNVSLNASASDDVAVYGVFANVTLPNSTVLAFQMPYNYTVQLAGRHNVTFWANDTSGNTGSSQGYFIAGSSQAPIQFNAVDSNLSGIAVNLTIYFQGTQDEVHLHEFTGDITDNHTDILYDLYYMALNGSASVRLNGVNLSVDYNGTLGLDKTAASGFLVTYGINNTYSITGAVLVLSYSGTGYANEDYLGIYRCAAWDFTARSCTGTWESVSGTQDKTGKTFTIGTTGFSAYSIKQESVPSAPVTPSGGVSGPSGVTTCNTSWVCGDWSSCLANGTQYRACQDRGSCAFPDRTESRSCTYVAPPEPPLPENCSDGRRNQDETGIDCGGVCGPTCEDGQPCLTDGDCVNSCNLVTGICHTPAEPAPSLLEMLYEMLWKERFLVAVLSSVIVFVAALAVLYRKKRTPWLPYRALAAFAVISTLSYLWVRSRKKREISKNRVLIQLIDKGGKKKELLRYDTKGRVSVMGRRLKRRK